MIAPVQTGRQLVAVSARIARPAPSAHVELPDLLAALRAEASVWFARLAGCDERERSLCWAGLHALCGVAGALRWSVQGGPGGSHVRFGDVEREIASARDWATAAIGMVRK